MHIFIYSSIHSYFCSFIHLHSFIHYFIHSGEGWLQEVCAPGSVSGSQCSSGPPWLEQWWCPPAEQLCRQWGDGVVSGHRQTCAGHWCHERPGLGHQWLHGAVECSGAVGGDGGQCWPQHCQHDTEQRPAGSWRHLGQGEALQQPCLSTEIIVSHIHWPQQPGKNILTLLIHDTKSFVSGVWSLLDSGWHQDAFCWWQRHSSTSVESPIIIQSFQ